MTVDLINYWLLLPKVWIIFGFALVILEILIGTGYISLSFGIAAILMSLIVYSQNTWNYSATLNWMDIAFLYGILSIVAILILKLFSQNQSATKDINKY